ncbi:putative dehydrogenase [Microbacterium resistens]|uniref:Dehydrogenase n=1 Tax=Microbacterium resistens TaxID=156977 RepID=A0ABU1SBT4_9MICO|nr:hypothetical protein [Microbacterium resistens]MDR6867085.1 putative dehydrogenase [Microbacterium resistens]
MRVVFAGLAHSHPFTDAANLRAIGGEVVGVHDPESGRAEEFAERFGGAVVARPVDLLGHRPDLVIATPHPREAMATAHALVGTVPVFVNKVLAATGAQLAAWDRLVAERRGAGGDPLLGTSSVLRFAPALDALAADLDGERILSLRVLAQHDAAAFRSPGRAWQDDPAEGGGTAVTVGIHAWEMIDRLLPDAVVETGAGWVRSSADVSARSEDVAGFGAVLRVPRRDDPVPVHAVIAGAPGDDAYEVEVVTDRGVRTVALDTTDPGRSLGFEGLVRHLSADVASGGMTAPWARSRTVVANSIRAAAIARGGRPAR